MALIIFLGIYLGSALILSWFFIEDYKEETEQNKVTLQEFFENREEDAVFAFCPFNSLIILAFIVYFLILYPIWVLIRKIKV